MNLSEDAPKLPKLPFLLGDLILLLTAAAIAYGARNSGLTPALLLALVACVGLGSVLAIIPFLLDYTRRRDAELAERQDALESLVRTTRDAIEQASVAANGLHQITELAQKTLRAAEHLPQKLQERLSEFNQQRDEAILAENEALQNEINTLRASEAEKLESATDQLTRATAEFARLESATREQLAQLSATLAQIPSLTEQLAQTTAGTLTQAAASARADAERALADARARATADLEQRLAAAGQSAADRVLASLARSLPASAPASPPPATAAPTAPVEPTPASSAVTPPPPKPARTPRPKPAADAPAPAEIEAPAATPTVDAPPASSPAPAPTPPAPAAARQPTARSAPSGPRQRSLDGVTRLTATAYIGIGNKLFLRGEGAGLSWDEGVPLQFVSIGKWRWETADASAPVKIRLYKNDQIESTSAGEIELHPGEEHEVTATF